MSRLRMRWSPTGPGAADAFVGKVMGHYLAATATAYRAEGHWWLEVSTPGSSLLTGKAYSSLEEAKAEAEDLLREKLADQLTEGDV